jgi:hypothetical protein
MEPDMSATLQHPSTPSARRPGAGEGEKGGSLSPAPRRRWPWLILAGAIVLLLLAVSQAILPSMAENRLKDRLAKDGKVSEVRVSAFPAVKLMFGKADDVQIRMDSFTPPAGGGETAGAGGGGGLGGALARTQATDKIDVLVRSLKTGPVTLRDARLTKDGDTLRAEATVSDAQLRDALPAGIDVRPAATPGGQLVFDGGVSALGFEARAQARLLARDGKLVIQLEDGPIGALATVPVFSDPRLDIQTISALERPGGFVVRTEAITS